MPQSGSLCLLSHGQMSLWSLPLSARPPRPRNGIGNTFRLFISLPKTPRTAAQNHYRAAVPLFGPFSSFTYFWRPDVDRWELNVLPFETDGTCMTRPFHVPGHAVLILQAACEATTVNCKTAQEASFTGLVDPNLDFSHDCLFLDLAWTCSLMKLGTARDIHSSTVVVWRLITALSMARPGIRIRVRFLLRPSPVPNTARFRIRVHGFGVYRDSNKVPMHAGLCVPSIRPRNSPLFVHVRVLRTRMRVSSSHPPYPADQGPYDALPS